jgi:hypothetical protein
MNRRFTQTITLYDINTQSIDLLADAFGYEYQYHQFIELLSAIYVEPEEECVSDLIKSI